MFLAKLLDQKQGEARVVDQKDQLRKKLDVWLKARPTTACLASLGVLGRAQRLAVARDVLEELFRSRQQKLEDDAARVPPGNFEYTERVCSLLKGKSCDAAASEEADTAPPLLKAKLAAVSSKREALQGQLKHAAEAWSEAAGGCRLAIGEPSLSDAAKGIDQALKLLEDHRSSTGSSLADVFSALRSFQRLVARRHSLENILSVVEKTDSVRKAVLAWDVSNALPLAELEEVPQLCASLPTRSCVVGLQRVRFLVKPLHDMLVRELDQALATTKQWPADATKAMPAACEEVEFQVVRICAEIQRVQHVSDDIRRRQAERFPAKTISQAGMDSEPTQDGEPWACSALASALASRFRHFFFRPESELCRMDKPEWALKYLLDQCNNHGALLDKWVPAALDNTTGNRSLSAQHLDILRNMDLPAGLAVALAREARIFIRMRIPLLAEKEARPTLMLTLEKLVNFHSKIGELGGPQAAAAALLDFDTNRPLDSGQEKKRAPAKKESNDASGGLMSGLAHLRSGLTANDTSAAGEEASRVASPGPPSAGGGGAADGGFMAGLAHLQKADQGQPESNQVCGAAAVKGAPSSLMAGLAHLRGVTEQDTKSSGGDQKPSVMPFGMLGGSLFAGLSQLRRGDSALDPGAAEEDAEPLAAPSPAQQEAPDLGEVGKGLLAGLSTFTDSIQAEAEAVEAAQDGTDAVGFLDVWTAVDAEVILDRLSNLCAPAGDVSAWRPRPLQSGVGIASSREEIQVAHLAALVTDMFEKSRERADCFASASSRKIYTERVLEVGLAKVVAAIKAEWNGMASPLQEARKAALVVETLEEICRFLDRFPLAAHMASTVDEMNALRLGMLEKLASSLVDVGTAAFRRLPLEHGVFSGVWTLPLSQLSKRLRPTNFQAVARRCFGDLAGQLVAHLLRLSPFQNVESQALFVANCRDDLGAVLSLALDRDVSVARRLWDACSLLALPEADAAEALAELQRIFRCAPSTLEPSSVLRDRQSSVFAAAGVEELPVADCIVVLGKRPELAASSDQDAVLGSLQGAALLLPGSHAKAAGLATLQLGAGALQHLQAPLAPGVNDLKNLFPLSLAGKLSSSLNSGKY